MANVSAPDNVPNYYYYQPFLFEFPQQLGKYPAGTLLLVGNLHDGNDTDFYSWRSVDHGKKWSNIGLWQTGYAKPYGAPKGTSGGIWEPFLFLDNQNNIVAVFSEEREYENHFQKLVHLISEDGVTPGVVMGVIPLMTWPALTRHPGPEWLQSPR